MKVLASGIVGLLLEYLHESMPVLVVGIGASVNDEAPVCEVLLSEMSFDGDRRSALAFILHGESAEELKIPCSRIYR